MFEEVIEVLAIDLNNEPAYDPDLKPLDPLDILHLCSTLVIKTKPTGNDGPQIEPTYTEYVVQFPEVIRLAHLSVKDYLVSGQIKKAWRHSLL